MCDGPCLGGFHLKCLQTDAVHSSDGVLDGIDDEDQPWHCWYCKHAQHPCGLCKKITPDSDMIRCTDVSCLKTFHAECLEKISFPKAYNAGNTPKTSREKAMNQIRDLPLPGSTDFVCPVHFCHLCHLNPEFYTNTKWKGTITRCLRCTRSYHSACLPPTAHILKQGLFCEEHPQALMSHDDGAEKGKERHLEFDFLRVDCLWFKAPMYSHVMFFDGVIKRDMIKEQMTEEENDGEEESAMRARNLQSKLSKQPKYTHVIENIYTREAKKVLKKMSVDNESMACVCVGAAPCNDDSCVNRALRTECHPSSCPVGDSCENQRIQKRSYASIKLIETTHCGFGAVCTEDLYPGDFVVEYVGEVVTKEQCDARLRKMEEEGKSAYYFFSINNSLVIDARKKGNYSRFINHACDPNCQAQRWAVGDVSRVGIFADRFIKAGTELTYNYRFFTNTKPPKKASAVDTSEEKLVQGEPVIEGEVVEKTKPRCHCGSRNCSEFLGLPPKKMPVEKKKKPKKRKSIANKAKSLSEWKNASDMEQSVGLTESLPVFETILKQRLYVEDGYADLARDRKLYLPRNQRAGQRRLQRAFEKLGVED